MLLDSGSDLNERIKHLEAKNLALREEVEAVKCENQAMIPYVELVDKLEADNQSLREQISALEGHIVGEEVEP